MTKQNSFITKLSNEQKRERLVFFAKKQIGKPFKWGVKKNEIGKFFDCSSFTQYLYKRIGIELPRTTVLQAYHGQIIRATKKPPFFQEKNLKIGDLIFFKSEKGHFTPEFPNGIGHVIMYLGNKKFIHVDSHGQIPTYSIGLNIKKRVITGKNAGVKIEKFSKIVNRKDFQIAKRILKD
jgi:cell wall-associated NlpC family hydrolase